MTRAGELFVVLILAASSAAIAQSRDHGAKHEPRLFDLGGYVETKFIHYQLRRESAFYKLEFAGLARRATLDDTSAALRLNGSARGNDWQLRFDTLSRLEHDQLSHESTNRFEQLVLSWKPRADFSLDAGKIALRWGKGHAWNPVAFAERPKDSSDPRLSREGYHLVAAKWSRDFSGALQNVTFTPVLLPVTSHINSSFGKENHLNVAARLQLDFGASETALYFLNSGSRAGRYGFDFTFDVASGLELYGEWARISENDFRLATPAGVSLTRNQAAVNYLAGLHYRTAGRQSFLMEWHHNGIGYTTREFQDFLALTDNALQPGADPALMQRAQRLYDGSFGRQKPMRDYLYLRASHDTLPYTPSVRATVNLQDGSYSIIPELLYSGHRRWGLRARFYLYGGGSGTEYGERYYSRRVELRLHYHF